MGRTQAFKHGRIFSLLIAGSIGYLLGGWHVTGLRTNALSAAQSVALRFPEDVTTEQPPNSIADGQVAAAPSTNILAMDDPQSALLNPQPMVGQTRSQTVAAQASVPQIPLRVASLDPAVPLTAAAATLPQAAPMPAAARQSLVSKAAAMLRDVKSAVAPVNRHAERPGFVLNDAQIVSIKRRLNLTPDQERMWPAVEAALRNLAYTTAHDARRRDTAPDAARLAAVADPNSEEVQSLKSAAIPLLMSFNSEQKDEVRSLVHVMGLDQLASEF